MAQARAPQRKRTKRVLMAIENFPYLKDPRVRKEAEALVAVGHRVSVTSPGREPKLPASSR